MLRGYRRRFVAINMALIALVLALALGMQVLYVYRSEYADLQKTMGLILEPWRGAGEGFRPQAAPPAGEETPKPPPGRDRIGNEQMITVFYDRAGGDMHILPEERPMDRDTVTLAAEAAAARAEDFGHLPEYDLYYKKQGSDSDLRIVLADSAYLSSRVWRSALALLGVYVLALGLFFSSACGCPGWRPGPWSRRWRWSGSLWRTSPTTSRPPSPWCWPTTPS